MYSKMYISYLLGYNEKNYAKIVLKISGAPSPSNLSAVYNVYHQI